MAGSSTPPVSVVGVNSKAEGELTTLLSYGLRTERPVTSVITEWTLQSLKTGEQVRVFRRVDGWNQNRAVATPAVDGRDDLRVQAAGHEISVANIRVVYVDFPDGTYWGDTCFAGQVRAERTKVIEAMKDFVIRSAGANEADLRRWIAEKPALEYLPSVSESGGWPAILEYARWAAQRTLPPE